MSSGLRWTGAARIITHVTDTTTVPRFTMADRLRKAREFAGMTQDELADAIGISRRTVTTYEHGGTRPSRVIIRGWALATGVPVDWLTSGDAVSNWISLTHAA